MPAIFLIFLSALLFSCRNSDKVESSHGNDSLSQTDSTLTDVFPQKKDISAPDHIDALDSSESINQPKDIIPDLGFVWDATEEVEIFADTEDTEICLPDCLEKQCGDDGCGSSCGSCKKGWRCNEAFLCEKCSPECEGRECGTDFCGGSCGECPTHWHCLGGMCIPGECLPYPPFFHVDFSHMPTGWLVDDNNPEDGVSFHISDLMFVSPPSSLYLGNPIKGNYEGEGRVRLKLTSTSISLSHYIGRPVLHLFLWMDLEPQVHPLYPYEHDVLFIKAIMPDGKPQVLFDSRFLMGSTRGEWQRIILDLSSLQNTSFVLEFSFDTIDDIDNDFVGVFIDDLQILVPCPSCRSDTDCLEDQESCVGFAGQDGPGLCF